MNEIEEKAFGLGVIVGRFQVLHRGHGDIIRKSLSICKRTAVLVGSSQESGTVKNPLDYETRKRLLITAFPALEVYPLPDIGVGNNCAWGDYVIEKTKEYCGNPPDILISGRESRRNAWLSEEYNIAELFAPKTVEISATQMIQFLLSDDRQSWEEYIEPAIKESYCEIKTAVLRSQNNRYTKSI